MAGSTSNQRVFGLDVFRATAILLVVLGHSRYWLVGTPFEGFPYLRTVDGVDLFFVLSGFLIGNILLKTIQAEGGFSGGSLLHFWKRRWFRTLPSYYLVLLINVLIVGLGIIHDDLSQFNWRFVFFLQNFSTPFHGFFWESWSLSVEEWFYLLFPVLLLLALQFLRPMRAYFATVLLMLSFSLLYRWSIYNPLMDDASFDFVLRKIVLTRLDSIGYGLLAAYLFLRFPGAWHRWKVPSFLLGAGGMACLLNLHPRLSSVYAQVFFLALVPISIMLMLPLATAIKTGRGFFGKAVVHISKISYSMYLLNLAVVMEVMRDNFPPEGTADRLGKFLLYWVLVVGISTLFYRFYEKPMMGLRDR